MKRKKFVQHWWKLIVGCLALVFICFLALWPLITGTLFKTDSFGLEVLFSFFVVDTLGCFFYVAPIFLWSFFYKFFYTDSAKAAAWKGRDVLLIVVGSILGLFMLILLSMGMLENNPVATLEDFQSMAGFFCLLAGAAGMICLAFVPKKPASNPVLATAEMFE